MSILVTGASGHVGNALIGELIAQGQAVRAMTRRPEALRGRAASVEGVCGDFGDASSLERAVAGMSAVFAMSAEPIGAGPAPTHDRALADACRRAGVRRIVKLSALGGGGTDPSSPV